MGIANETETIPSDTVRKYWGFMTGNSTMNCYDDLVLNVSYNYLLAGLPVLIEQSALQRLP